MAESKSLLSDVLLYIKETYGVEAEYLWESSPANGAVRNPYTKKWFGVILGSLPVNKLREEAEGKADVINLKCDPILSFNVVDYLGVYPGFHMNKEHWISVLLDGSVELERVKMLIDMSYDIVDRKRTLSGKRKSKR